MKSAKPHVSDAIRQLRSWVTLAATVLALCCATQMLAYAFSAYTDVRWDTVQQQSKTDKPLRVVGAESDAQPALPIGNADAGPAPLLTRSMVTGGVRGMPAAAVKAAGPIETNRVHSPAELWMRRASDIAAGAGVIAAFCLALLTMLGVVVAGGGCVPGVERATTAAVWSMILAMLCVPWGRIMPGIGVPGIFATYADMTAAIDGRVIGGTAAGTLGLGMQWVAAPLVVMFTALGVCFWFRAGVEQGVIIRSPSELDRAVEREVEMIQKRGVAATAPKAVGALNQAFGSSTVIEPETRRGAPAGTLSAVERGLEEAAIRAASERVIENGVSRRRVQMGVADGDFKRPI